MAEVNKYNVIYADPPWQYRDKSGRDFKHGAAEKYATMPLDEIKAMPVADLSAKNSMLFIWVTVPLIEYGFETMAAWGFKYKTMLTWRKVMSLGMGYWFRGQCEHLLLGIRGRVKACRLQKPNFYQCRAGKHSEKPHHFRQLIVEAAASSFPNPKMLELFARSRDGLFPDYEYHGWDLYGNQVNNSIILPNGSGGKV